MRASVIASVYRSDCSINVTSTVAAVEHLTSVAESACNMIQHGHFVVWLGCPNLPVNSCFSVTRFPSLPGSV